MLKGRCKRVAAASDLLRRSSLHTLLGVGTFGSLVRCVCGWFDFHARGMSLSRSGPACAGMLVSSGYFRDGELRV